MEQLMYRPAEAAQVLGICRTRVFALIKSGQLRSVKLGAARYITAEALRAFVRELEQESSQSCRRGGGVMPARKPNKRSSIYLGSDGWWHGWVTIGSRDDGSPDRRHRKARTEAAVTRKVRDLERTRDSGHLPGAGRPVTVGQWMETWLTTIAPRRVRRSTLETTYAPKVRNRIIPGLGKHRLDRLTPEHIERFYTRLEAEGLAPATVLQIHRILSRALKVAMQRGYVTRNVATLVDAPSASHDEIEPLTLDEALRIIRLAATQRNGTRWSVALALGLRQGEALGLRWQHVDLEAGTLAVRWQLQRFAWQHGCADPDICSKRPSSRRLPTRLHTPCPCLARSEPAAGSTSPSLSPTRAGALSRSRPRSSRPSKRIGPPSSMSA